MPGRLLVGEPSNGKTWLLKHFMSTRLKHSSADGETTMTPVAFVNSPPRPNQNELYARIITAIDGPISAGMPASDRFDQICVLSRRVGLKMLIIDEVHNQIAGPKNIQRVMANVIKDLTNELNIPVVLAGTTVAHNVLQIDDQLATRFPSIELPMWHFDETFCRLLTNLQKQWQIDFDIEGLGPRIIALSNPNARTNSGSSIGRISELVESAATHARERGTSNLQKADFENCEIAKGYKL
jgi:hypothetical protein